MHKFKLSLNKKTIKKLSLTLSLALTLGIFEVPLSLVAKASDTTSTQSTSNVIDLKIEANKVNEYTFDNVKKIDYSKKQNTNGQIVGKFTADTSGLIDITLKKIGGKFLKVYLEDVDNIQYYQSYILTRTEEHKNLFQCFKGRTYNLKLLCLSDTNKNSYPNAKVQLGLSFKSLDTMSFEYLSENGSNCTLSNLSTQGYLFSPQKTGVYQIYDDNDTKVEYYFNSFGVPSSSDANQANNTSSTQNDTSNTSQNSTSTTDYLSRFYNQKIRTLNTFKEIYLEKGQQYYVIFLGTDLRSISFSPKIRYVSEGLESFTIQRENNEPISFADKNEDDIMFDVNISYKKNADNEELTPKNISGKYSMSQLQLMGIDVQSVDSDGNSYYYFSSVAEKLIFTYLNKTTETSIKLIDVFDYIKNYANTKTIALNKPFNLPKSTLDEYGYIEAQNCAFFKFKGKTGAYELNYTVGVYEESEIILDIYDSNGICINANVNSDNDVFYLKDGQTYYAAISYSAIHYFGNSLTMCINESKTHKHVTVVDKAKAATYTHTGLTAGSHCKLCGKVIKKQTVIPKKSLPKLNKTQTTIKKGKKFTLKLNGATSKIIWSTNNKNIAKVTNFGVVTGVKKGKATISARFGGKVYKCIVTVK